MDYLSLIQQPIEAELSDFISLFQASLDHHDGMLGQALNHIKAKGGKRMRPILILLMARNFGQVSSVTQHAARSEEHTSELQSRQYLVCRLLLEKKNTTITSSNVTSVR